MFTTPNHKKVRMDEMSPESPMRNGIPASMSNQLMNLGMRVRKSINDGYKTDAQKSIYGMPTSTTDVSPQKTGEGMQAYGYQQVQQQQAQQQQQNSKKRPLITDFFPSGQQ